MRCGHVAWLALTACGRVGFDANGDAGGDGAMEPMFVTVDPSTLPPFPAPQLVTELSLSGIDEDDPALTRDQLEIFFDRDDGTGNDLYTSRRASIAESWPPAVPIVQLNTNATEEHPHVTADGLRLYFTSGRGGDAQIYVSSRVDRDTPFGAPVLVDALNSTEYEAMGSVSADERVAVLSSQRGGLTVDELYEARRSSADEPWDPPQLIAELAPVRFDRAPHVDDLGLVMFYDSGNRLLWTRRDAVGTPWTAPIELTELDIPGEGEVDAWLSPDLRTIYFTRIDSAGQRDIYTATR